MSSPQSLPGFTPAPLPGLFDAPAAVRRSPLSGFAGASKSPFCHYCKATHFDQVKNQTVVEWFDLVIARPLPNFISEDFRRSLEDEPANVLQLEYPTESQGFQFGSYVIPELSAMDCTSHAD